MDKRLYFVLGDLFVNVLGGSLIGWVIWLLTPGAWNMWLVMLIAMVLGMLFAVVLFIPASMFLGAMEVMVPLMLTGMVAGMAVGMHAGMTVIGAGQAVFEGALAGLAVIVVVWIINHCLRGPQLANLEDARND